MYASVVGSYLYAVTELRAVPSPVLQLEAEFRGAPPPPRRNVIVSGELVVWHVLSLYWCSYRSVDVNGDWLHRYVILHPAVDLALNSLIEILALLNKDSDGEFPNMESNKDISPHRIVLLHENHGVDDKEA
jgi:hypothetical protein